MMVGNKECRMRINISLHDENHKIWIREKIHLDEKVQTHSKMRKI
jgi:hypothetical protein